MARSGAEILVDQLLIHGARRAYGVPGESYLAVLDALVDRPDLQFVVTRHESGAAIMAEAEGKLTGRPGLAFVTRGPGATNASAGLHIAFQDSTPMILFIGQVSRGLRGREGFQEVDYTHLLGPLTKWTAEIDDPARIPEFIARAFSVATSGRPGPVALALPEDMLVERATAPDMPAVVPTAAGVDPLDLDALEALLRQAQRPFVLVGGGGWSEAAKATLERWAAANALPVGVSFRCQDYIDNDHPSYVGHVGIGLAPDLRRRIEASDLVIALGPRLGEMTTQGYELLKAPLPDQTLVHIHPDPEELGRVYRPSLAICASPARAVEALAARPAITATVWSAETLAARAAFEAFATPGKLEGPLQLGEIFADLRRVLPPDAILCNGAGNYTSWAHRFHRWRRWRTQLAPTSGSMGYGVPAAVAAKLTHPERPVVALAGDGCFLMTGQELATAAQYDLAVVFLVLDNGMYGTIRMHQERDYPGRVSATSLNNPDFAALARSYGLEAWTVEVTEQFGPAFESALACGGPALLHLKVDPEAITPTTTLEAIRETSLASIL
ncbi:thiamine pyrophosphate-binding protein [Algihabitans albus]|uniref:thiamine pyrophosphate-binding protein n=1 Tax=Algihabitans albus TaxID=2164067 RepID=UPI000E5C8B99|nr:thiamine pyrophosphate-binding protein [Algihabitans albus]